MARYDDCLAVILKNEGGYVNNPADPGGATNQGITQGVYDAYRHAQSLPQQPVQFITSAEVSAIYFNNYWLPAHCDTMRVPLDLVVFDTAVNMGVSGAMTLLGQAANVDTGGIVSTGALQVIGNFDPMSLAAQTLDQREAKYKAIVAAKPQQGIFLKGWLNRLDTLRTLCGIPTEN
jgi:lysozyme family protein